jgi:putative spermidine/putrescine transport system permease protein
MTPRVVNSCAVKGSQIATPRSDDTGNHWLFQCDTECGPAIVIRQNDGTPRPAEGEAVRLAWRVEDMSLRASGGVETHARWALTLPALMLFVGELVIPLVMTVMLSFHDWGQYKGIEPVFILKNWQDIASDPYYARRTFRIALLATLIATVLGAPEAYILNRMSGRWKGFFLLLILGPLLILVLARTLGWALLFGGNNGLVNKLLMSLGPIRSPLPFMFTETSVVVAVARAMMPFLVLSVWAALQRVDPQVENAAMSLGAGAHTIILPQIMPGVLSGAIIMFSLSASAFATPAILGGRRLKVVATLAYGEFLNTLNWPLGATVAVLLLLLALALIVVGSNALIERRYAEVFR